MAFRRQVAGAVLAAGIGAVEHRQMLRLQMRRTFQGHGAAAMGVGGSHLGGAEAQGLQHVEAGRVEHFGGQAQHVGAERLPQGPFVEGEADVVGVRQRIFQALQGGIVETARTQVVVVDAGGPFQGAMADGIGGDRVDLVAL